jgi:hypothetical protein
MDKSRIIKCKCDIVSTALEAYKANTEAERSSSIIRRFFLTVDDVFVSCLLARKTLFFLKFRILLLLRIRTQGKFLLNFLEHFLADLTLQRGFIQKHYRCCTTLRHLNASRD